MKRILSEVYENLKKEQQSEDLENQLRRLSARINSSKESKLEAVAGRRNVDTYYYFCQNMLIEKKGKKIKCCCILNQSYFSVFDAKKLHLRIPLTEVVCAHPLSVLKKNGKFGMFLGCINVSAKKFFKFELETKDGNSELDLVKIVQQVALVGEVKEGFRGIDSRTRRLLCIINPASGALKSEPIFEAVVRPIFEICHFMFDVITTSYRFHATEICKKLELGKYTDIVSVGGDGILYEIIQGLFQHPQLPYEEIKKINISMIPTGTGNGLSWCMGSQISPVLAALITARGRTVPYNVLSMLTPKEKVFSFLFFAYGAMPDVDLGYQSIKWMGDFKYVVGGALSCINRTRYPMKIQYVQLEGETESPKDPYEFPTEFGNAYGRHLNNNMNLRILKPDERKKDPPLTLLERHFGKELKEMLSGHGETTIEEEEEKEGEQEEEEGDNNNIENYKNIPTIVKEITDPAFYLCVGNARKFSVDFWGAGRATPGNGSADLVWCEKVGLVGSLKVFSKMVGEKPDYLDDPLVNSARIKAFYFVPDGPPFSVLDIDGEELEMSPVMGMVHKGLLSVCHLETPW